jgi:capsular exopolysaccharide synthesis family protein
VERVQADRRAAPGPEPGAPLRPGPTGEFELRWFLQVLRRRVWLVVGVLGASLAAALVLTSLSIPLYTAETVLLIERRPSAVTELEPINDADAAALDPHYYKKHFDLLRSRTLAARVIAEEALERRPHFLAPLVGPIATRRSEGDGSAAVEPALINAYLKHWLVVEPFPESPLVRLSFRSADPELSSRVANAHARAFIERGLALRNRANEEAMRFLESSLAELRPRTETGAATAADARKPHSLKDAGGLLTQRIYALTRELATAEAERFRLESQMAAIGRGDLESLPAVTRSQAIAKLRAQLAILESRHSAEMAYAGPRHPEPLRLRAEIKEVRSAIDEEVLRIADQVRSRFEAARATEARLGQALAEQNREARRLEDESLLTGTESTRRLYELIRHRLRELEVAIGFQASNVAVMDEAFPPKHPDWPDPFLNFLAASLLGLVVGAGLAFGLEILHRRLDEPELVERILGLANLGVVPRVGSLKRRTGAEATEPPQPGPPVRLLVRHGAVIRGDPFSLESEAYRSIRTNLLLCGPAGPPRTLLFTSAVQGEGKTTVALNTALALAQAGRTVLVIDADLRQARCRHVLGLESQPGLVEYLGGPKSASPPIQEWKESLSFLAAGGLPSDPSELLGSERMATLLESLTEQYAFVLIDSPPVLPVSDALLLSPAVDATVLVVDAGRTTHQQAREACSRLVYANAHLIGTVLNKVGPEAPCLGHSYRYHYVEPKRLAHGASHDAR